MQKEQFKEDEEKRVLQELLYNISYDLKSPVRIMNCFMELLLSNIESKLDERQLQYVKYMRQSGDKLSQMVMSLAEFSRLDAAKFASEEVDIASIVRKIRADFSESFDLELDDFPVIFANPQKIKILFANLLRNSLMFKTPDLEPKIKISHELTDDSLILKYSDNSIGVENKYHRDIFKIFFKINNDHPNSPGLGLAVVKKIVDLYGGKIDFRSKKNSGIEMDIILNRDLVFAKNI